MRRNAETKPVLDRDLSLTPDRGGLDPVQDRAPDIAETVRSLMIEYADPARVLELYYWTQEPGLIDVIRSLMALPAQPRAALQSFLLMAPNPKLVRTTIDGLGGLTLSSPQVANTVTSLREAMKRK